MGMDYMPRHNVDSFHLNWSGHSWMGALLQQLDADLSEWDGSNDGKYIKTATCKDWAKRLRDCTPKLMVMSTADSGYSGGWREWPLVGDFGKALAPGSYIDMLEHMRAKESSTWQIEPADQETIDHVLSFAEFLETCGGCRQY